MKRLRVLVLVHPDLVPPEEVRDEELLKAPWKMEYDVRTTLRWLEHEPVLLGVGNELAPIRRRVEELEPHIVFNLLEGFDDIRALDAHVTAYLELLGVPITGCGPRGLMLSRDKALTKKILDYHRIPCPGFATFRPGARIRAPRRLRYPLIVKAVDQDSSSGIAQASVCEDFDALRDRVRFVHESLETTAIAEEFIAGREIYVGLIGNHRLTALHPWELKAESLPPSGRLVATEAVKFSDRYQKRYGIRWGPAELDEATSRRLHRKAKRTFRALDLAGYARIDFRLDADGRAYVIEANANPDIGYGSEFAESAHLAGIEYEQLIAKILRLGLARHAER